MAEDRGPRSPLISEAAVGPVLDAVKVTGANSTPGTAAVTYRVIEPQATSSTSDKRGETRRRTLLRSGKILDADNKFLVDCQVYDRSSHGARLRLVANLKLPTRFRLFDDVAKEMLAAKIAWRHGQNVGITFLPQPAQPPLSEAEITALRRQFYVA